jgi:hypothetical protein
MVSGGEASHILAVTEFRPDREGEQRARTYFFRSTDFGLAAKKAVDLFVTDQTNIYFQCTLLKAAPLKGRGTKELVAGSTLLWVDIDATQNRSVEDILNDLRHFKPRPSWINVSGGGTHAYWKLNEFVEDLRAIEDRNRWLLKQLGGDACWSAEHILRVPGTQNLKDRENPREVSAVRDFTGGPAYALEDFPTAPPVDGESDLDLGVGEEPLPEDFLDAINQDLRQRIEIGPIEKKDRSSNDWFIARRLLELGYTAGQVLTVLTHPRWFSGEKGRTHGFGYPKHTVARALSEHQTKYDEGIELQPVIDAVLIQTDKDGVRRKVAVLQGSEFVIPALRHLEQRGYRFHYDRLSNQPYIISPQGDSVVAISGPEYERWIYKVSGFTAEEREHRILRSGLSAHTRQNGAEITLAPWCYHDGQKQQVYVLLDKYGRDVLRLTKDKAEIVPNGTDGLVLQKSNLVATDLRWTPNVDVNEAMRQLLKLTTEQFACDSRLAALLTCYMLAAPLIQGFSVQTFPLLHLTGRAGFGKTQTMGMISTFLHGRPELLSGITMAAAYRMADKEVLMPFDDYERLDETLKQFILT